MISRLLSAFVMLLAATACSPAVIPLTVRDPAEPYFVRVLEGTASERSEALTTLRREYPESPWTGRARITSELLRNRDALTQKLRQAEQERGAAQQEKGACQQESQTLQQEAARLREDLEKLKKLLINMEKRSSK